MEFSQLGVNSHFPGNIKGMMLPILCTSWIKVGHELLIRQASLPLIANHSINHCPYIFLEKIGASIKFCISNLLFNRVFFSKITK